MTPAPANATPRRRQCSAIDLDKTQCRYPATIEHEGGWRCWIHDPVNPRGAGRKRTSPAMASLLAERDGLKAEFEALRSSVRAGIAWMDRCEAPEKALSDATAGYHKLATDIDNNCGNLMWTTSTRETLMDLLHVKPHMDEALRCRAALVAMKAPGCEWLYLTESAS